MCVCVTYTYDITDSVTHRTLATVSAGVVWSAVAVTSSLVAAAARGRAVYIALTRCNTNRRSHVTCASDVCILYVKYTVHEELRHKLLTSAVAVSSTAKEAIGADVTERAHRVAPAAHAAPADDVTQLLISVTVAVTRLTVVARYHRIAIVTNRAPATR